MSEATPPPADSTPSDLAASRPRRSRWQVGLRTLFLLVLAIAVWMGAYINRRRNAWLEARITALRPLAHELVVEDPRQVAVVRREPLWFDQNEWDLYLPDGDYRLCLATRDIDDRVLAPVVKSTRLGPGYHHLTLDQQPEGTGWRVTVRWGQAGRMVVEEPKAWDAGRGSSGGGEFDLLRQLPANQPVVLFRRRFMRPDPTGTSATTPPGPSEGILLWIERRAKSAPAPKTKPARPPR